MAQAFNVVLAGLAGLLLSPLLLLIALAVWLDSGRPVIYAEARLGQFGRRFRFYKFRTLRPDYSEVQFVAPVGDRRVTRVGGFLRRWHLDELPQLVNIMRGEMNFVGPRTERAELWHGVAREQRERALVHRPGLTSPAGLRYLCEDAFIAGFNDPLRIYRDIIFPAKIAEDIAYFENRNPWSDLVVLFRTATGFRVLDDPDCFRRLERLLDRAESPAAAGRIPADGGQPGPDKG